MWFWPQYAQKYSLLLQNGGWLGGKWSYWAINLALIQVPSLMNLAHELILGLKWHPYHSQPHTHVDLAIVATKLRTFAPKWGLAW